MAILQESDRRAVKARFDDELKDDVRLTFFTQQNIGGLFVPGRGECATCAPTQQLLEELCELSDKLSLETMDFYRHEEEAKALGVDKIPATVISGGNDGDVKFYGLPSGTEFTVLLDALVSASTRESSLQQETQERLKGIEEDVHIQVFVTPT